MSRRYRPFDPFERGGPLDARSEFRMPQVPRRFWGGVALFALAVLIFIAASPIVSFITELQWYDSLGFRDVYTTRLGLDFMAVLLIGALYSWRGDSFDFRPAPRALAHISVLIAAFAVTLAVSAWLGRYDLLFAHNSTVVWGAAYTDVNARLPLYTFQAGAGIVLAGAVLANAW